MRAPATIHSIEQKGAAETEVTLTCREERVSCWDAKHRVWKALDLIGHHAAKPPPIWSTTKQTHKP